MTDTQALRYIRHRSGLEIRIAEQPDFGTACAQLCVRYGAVHLTSIQNRKMLTVPLGTAHYLEHLLFENADGNVDQQFAALGASSNAYTEADNTVYLFRTARHFPEALGLLLDFVQQPYFTERNIAKERGIISQEIAEYSLDSPDDRLFFLLLEGLYHAHPVRYDAAGTQESILGITPEILQETWARFYNPRNMVLCCAGKVRADDILRIADDHLSEAPPFTAKAILPDEPETAAQPLCKRKMAVGRPQFALGFKLPPVHGEDAVREPLLAMLGLEYLAGGSSPFTKRALRSGLLSDPLSTDCFLGDGWFTAFIEGEADDPEKVAEALLAELETVRQNGIDERRFAILKRCACGDLLMARDCPPAMAEAMQNAWLCGVESPDLRMELLRALTADDLMAFLTARCRTDRVSLAIIEPN